MNAGAKGMPAATPISIAPSDGERRRLRGRDGEAAERSGDEARARRRRASRPGRACRIQPPSGREATPSTSVSAAIAPAAPPAHATLALEERRHPVAEHDAQPEREGEEHRELVEASVPKHAAGDVRLPRGAGGEARPAARTRAAPGRRGRGRWRSRTAPASRSSPRRRARSRARGRRRRARRRRRGPARRPSRSCCARRRSPR